jgi:hypothetical protein
MTRWSGEQGSNLRPFGPKPNALPPELPPDALLFGLQSWRPLPITRTCRLPSMAIRAAHHAFRELISERSDGCADIGHLANVVSFRSCDVVKFEYDWIRFTAIYARRVDKHLRKEYSVSLTIFALVFRAAIVMLSFVALIVGSAIHTLTGFAVCAWALPPRFAPGKLRRTLGETTLRTTFRARRQRKQMQFHHANASRTSVC